MSYVLYRSAQLSVLVLVLSFAIVGCVLQFLASSFAKMDSVLLHTLLAIPDALYLVFLGLQVITSLNSTRLLRGRAWFLYSWTAPLFIVPQMLLLVLLRP